MPTILIALIVMAVLIVVGLVVLKIFAPAEAKDEATHVPSRTGLITVAARPGGGVTSVIIDRQALRLHEDEIAAELLDTVVRAQRSAGTGSGGPRAQGSSDNGVVTATADAEGTVTAIALEPAVLQTRTMFGLAVDVVFAVRRAQDAAREAAARDSAAPPE